MKLDVRSYFDVGRPPSKFRRNRSPFDTRMVDRSGTVIGLLSDVFGVCKLLSGRNPPSHPHVPHLHSQHSPPTPTCDRNRLIAIVGSKTTPKPSPSHPCTYSIAATLYLMTNVPSVIHPAATPQPTITSPPPRDLLRIQVHPTRALADHRSRAPVLKLVPNNLYPGHVRRP